MKFNPDLMDSLISNTSKSNLKTLRKAILNAFSDGLNAVDPNILIKNAVQIKKKDIQDGKFGKILSLKGYNNQGIIDVEEDISNYNSCLIIGGGKATAPMAEALINILANYMECYGIINIPHGQNWGNSIEVKDSSYKCKIKVNYSAHPVPDINGMNGTMEMVKLAKNASENTLIFILISGGGSSLMPLPRDIADILSESDTINELSLEDLQKVNSFLLKSGADINEVNTVRKHLSGFKGGNLAKYIYPKRGLALILSDVIGDKLDVIASGPTVPDSSTFFDVEKILKKYKLIEEIGIKIKDIIDLGLKGEIPENPKENDIIFKNISNIIVGSANYAKESIIKSLNSNGMKNLIQYLENIDLGIMDGEASEFGIKLSYLLMGLNDPIFIQEKTIQKDVIFDKNQIYYLITTGEFTVTIKGKGKGGRNQEMLLGLLNHLIQNMHDYDKIELENIDFCILSMAFDGIEGNSPSAGAIIDSETISRINKQRIDTQEFLKNNNSYEFFSKLNDSIITGQTQTNINDICALLIKFK